MTIIYIANENSTHLTWTIEKEKSNEQTRQFFADESMGYPIPESGYHHPSQYCQQCAGQESRQMARDACKTQQNKNEK